MTQRKIKRLDPTRTATLRREFVAAIKRRFRLVKGAIIKLIDDEDALGLKPDLFNQLTTNAGQWKFESTPQKVKSFQNWLKKQFADKLHGADDNKLWETYINAGFKKGAARAFEDVNKKAKLKGLTDDKKLAWYQGSKSQFLQSSFANPVSVDKVKLLAGRTFSDLEGITQAMSTKTSRTLTDGLVQGKSPHDIAKDLVDSVGIEEARASTLARTELIRAHAEGQLQALEEMGVEEVGVEVEWTVTPDEKLCPECEAMAEVVLPIAEAKGMIPRHPNCRCAWIPANVGESSKGQKSGKAAEKAIEVSFGKDDEDDDEGWGPTKNAGWTDLVDNAFCATGAGGGIDNSCSAHGGGIGASIDAHIGANTYENFAKAGNKIQHTQKALQDIAKSLGLKTSVNVMKDSDFNAFVDAGAKAVGVNPSLIRAVYKPNADTANFRESTINKIQSADDHRLFLQTAYHELGHAYDAKVLGRKADYGHTKATTSMSAYDNSKAEAFADAFGSRMILAQKKITGVGKYPKTWKDKTTKQIIEETKDVV